VILSIMRFCSFRSRSSRRRYFSLRRNSSWARNWSIFSG